jgi:protein-S-isoprenylcysteine O-methyltransferase Ste14
MTETNRGREFFRGPAQAAGASALVALVFLGGLIVGLGVNLFLPLPVWPNPWIQIIAIAPLAIGVGVIASARIAFRRHRTPMSPLAASAELVQDGPYKFTRNPQYLAFALIYLSVSLLFDSAYVLIMLPVILVLFDRTQIPREERYLQERFGEEYSRYKAKVRRWI